MSPKRIYRSKKHARIAGVCAGIAISQGWSVGGVRLIALLTILCTGVGALAYLAAWMILPVRDDVLEAPLDNKSLVRSRGDRKIAGVCGGVAHFLDVDPSIVRIILVLLVLLAGIGILPYVVAWIVIPNETETATAGF